MRVWEVSRRVTLVCACLSALGCRKPAKSDTSSLEDLKIGANASRRFHCAFDATCPEVVVKGDPFATLGTRAAPFRGYGDPSLEFDPEGRILWLSYSWLQTSVSSAGPPVVDFTVQTHLARSLDGGRSFEFVRKLNDNTREMNPRTGADGWMNHEVSTLVRRGPQDWEVLWLTYHDPVGEGQRSEFHYRRAQAASPDALGPGQAWISGHATSKGWGIKHRLDRSIPELSNCAAFTEPALFHERGATYLATYCVVYENGARKPVKERMVLLRERAQGYEWVGTLLDGADAVRMGVDFIEQADLARARDGSIVLLATPIFEKADPRHRGCVVYEVEDLGTASLVRDSSGALLPRVHISADGNGLGPGLCTYDVASETGVLLVMTKFDLTSSPPELLFSLRATGVHP